MRRTLFSVAVGLVMSMMAVHVKPANADECPQFSKDTRDIVARAVRDVVSENTSIGPSMSRSTVIGRVLEFTMMRVHVRDQARVANEIRSAFTGSDDAIFEMIKVCFPSWATLIEASDNDPLKRSLRDAYTWWRYVSFCNQVREGYVVQYVNDAQLQRARAAVKAIEQHVTAKDPSIDKDQIWNQVTGASTTLRLIPVMCENALSRLLNAQPGGAITIPKP